MRDMGEAETSRTVSANERPSPRTMKTIDSARLATRQKDLSVSVQISDLTPPCRV